MKTPTVGPDRPKRILAGVAALLMASVATWAASPPPLVLHDVNLVPLTGERVVEGVTVLVRDGRIAGIGAREALQAPPGATVVEAAGLWLLPGLVEMHVHLRDGLALDLFLGNGVTSIRNMDGTPRVLAWREAVADGRLRGPEITSGSPFLHRHARDAPERYVGSADEARRMVRRIAAQGYDYVKIAELDDEPFFALMDEARKVGIPVVGHIPNYDLDLERVLAEGMTSVEHIEELYRVWFDSKPDETKIAGFVDLVRRSGVPVSTLLRSEEVMNGLFAEREAYLTPERLARALRYNGPVARERLDAALKSIAGGDWQRPPVDVDFVLRLVRELYRAGVVLVPGTDSGGSFVIAGFGLHEELALYERAGLTPYEALRTATVNAARVLGQLDRKGTVEVGKQADLILVDANPLEGLGTLREPVGMVLRGEWIDAGELARLRRRTWEDASAEPADR